MPNQNNFNKLVFLKKFNNYFNRKIFGGPSLEDYVFNGVLENPVNTFEYNVEFGKNDIFDFANSRFYLRDNPTAIPYGLNFLNFDWSIENGGGYSFSVDFSYHPETRIIQLLVNTDAPSKEDIPNTFKLLLKVNFENNIFAIRENINFNQNDQIATEIVVNNLEFNADYLLVLNENDEILSRWFILRSTRTRNFQTNLQLRRDIVFDNIDSIKVSPVFVQKGMLEDNDPFVVNDEGMKVNQIKTKETKLVDKSGVAWLTIYIAKNAIENSYETFQVPSIAVETFIYKDTLKTSKQEFDLLVLPAGEITVVDKDGTEFVCDSATAFEMISSIGRQLDAACYDIQLLPYCPVQEAITSEGKLDLRLIGSEHIEFEYLKTYLHDIYQKIRLTREDFGDPVLKLDGKYHLEIIYSEAELNWATIPDFTVASYYSSPSTSNPTFSQFTYDGENFLDIDILCGDSLTSVPDVVEFTFSYIKKQPAGIKKGIMLYCGSATFEANLKSIDGSLIGTNLNKKESSNLQLFRLCSPNYQGSFDINIAKNNNKLEDIRAFCTYKPYTPFIKVAPSFEFLYGSNFKDARGLICGGDFSLPRSTDAWQTYQLNNKNYQNIFNREIQNMEFTYSIEQRNQIITGAVGVFAGMGAGAAAGAMVGGPWGALAGAVIGGITSGVGMAIDAYTLEAQYKENKDLAVDKFNYQLGNIQALPYTLTKVGNFDIISKIYPFVEEYNCTAEELEAFRRKIKYESMTVMRIDQMVNFMGRFNDLCYFKGELIRNDQISADSYVLAVIYEELLKGVYL